jgi:mono/diheme cytochrome c family protein
MLIAVLSVAAAVLIYSVQNWTSIAKARKLKNPFPPNPQALAAGADIYSKHCQSCHGRAGDGKGDKAAELSVAPGDFTDTLKMSGQTDGELYWQITKGRRPMPAFANKLNEEQRWQVTDYIRTFAQTPRNSIPADSPTGSGQR